MWVACASLSLVVAPPAMASKITIDVRAMTVEISDAAKFNGMQAQFFAKDESVAGSATIVAGKATIEHLLGGTGAVGTTIRLGGETWSKLGFRENKNKVSDEQAGGKLKNAGGGRADPPLGTPPTVFDFSPAIFDPDVFPGAIPLVFDQTIQVGGLPPLSIGQPTSFTGRIEFAPTDDPALFTAQFTAWDFLYPSFDVPALGLSGITRQVLDSSLSLSGFLDIEEGTLLVPLPAIWLSASGVPVTTSYDLLEVEIVPFSESLVDITVTSSGTFGFVPEPSALLLLGCGLATLMGFSGRYLSR